MLATSNNINWNRTPPMSLPPAIDFSHVTLMVLGQQTALKGKLVISRENHIKWQAHDQEQDFSFLAKDISKLTKLDANKLTFVSLSQSFEFGFQCENDTNRALQRMAQPTVKRMQRKSLSFGDEDDDDEEVDDLLMSATTVDENSKPMDYRLAARILASKQASTASRDLAAKHLSASGYAYVHTAAATPRMFSSLDEQIAWEKQEFNKILPKIRMMKTADEADKTRVEKECQVKMTRMGGGMYRYVDALTGEILPATEFARRYTNAILPKPPPTSNNSKKEKYELALKQEVAKLHKKFDQALAEYNAAKLALDRLYL